MKNAESTPPSGRCNVDVIIEAPQWHNCGLQLSTTTQIAVDAALRISGVYDYIPKLELAILLTNDAKLQELNRDFRNIDKPTNVLSFPNHILNPQQLHVLTQQNDIFLGDIAISFDRVFAESSEQNKEFHAHYVHILVHSVLHLLGFDHETPADATHMESLEISILAELKINNPYIIN